MTNSVLSRILEIEKKIQILHAEAVEIKNRSEQRAMDIANKRAKAESDYQSALALLNNSDNLINAAHAQRLSDIADSSNRENTNLNNAKSSQNSAIQRKYDTIIKNDHKYIAWLDQICGEIPEKIRKQYGSKPTMLSQIRPDLEQIRQLYERIMTDTAESFAKKLACRDGYYHQGDMQRDLILLSAKAKLFLENEIRNAKRDSQLEKQQVSANIEASRQQALSSKSSAEVYSTQKKDASLQSNQVARNEALIKKKKTLEQLASVEAQYAEENRGEIAIASLNRQAFFSSSLITAFAKETTVALKDTGAFSSDWDYLIDRTPSKLFSCGKIRVPVRTESKSLLEGLKKAIPEYFDGTHFCIPMLVNTSTSSKMYVRYDSANKKYAYETIQAYILQKIRSNPVNSVQVYFADPNDRGQNLGVLIAPNDKNEQIGIFAKNAQEEISNVLKEIETYIDTTNGVLENCESIFEYNANHETKLYELVIVLCDVQNCVSHNDISRLKVIWENAERFGINLILTSETPVDRIEQCYENKNTDLSFLRQRLASVFFYDAVKHTIAWANESYSYTPTTIGDVHKRFISNYREQIIESLKLNNKFADIRNRMQVDYANDRQRKLGKSVDSVKLPVLINTNTNKIDTDFEIGTSNDVHMLVTGGTGSGKSRFLFSIISSIAMNYHPDDVELWLIDCKINEFKPFIDRYRLPHIKLVALERTEEFCRAFFKYLSEVVAERVKLFGKMGKKSFDEYRAAMGDPYCMPRIIIIVDEFHALIQVLNDDRKLKLEMENALAEYRSYGISFIFSDQSYEKITMSLQQVNCRIALRGDVENMKQTLRLKGSYSQQLISDFEKSEGKGDAWWGKKVPTRFKNVFISETQEQAFFEEMANKWSSQVRNPKQPIFIDGAKRYPYDKTTAMCTIRDKQAQLDEFDDYQMDLVLGQPTTFESCFSICMRQNRRENLLLLGESEMSADVIGSIIKSLQYNGPTRIIAIGDRSDRNFKKFRRYAVNNSLDNIEIYHEYEDICNIVYELNQKVQSKKEFRIKTVLFWFALDSLCEEFGDFSQFRKDAQHVVSSESSQVKTISEKEKNQFLTVAEELSTNDDDFDISGLFQAIEPEPQTTISKDIADSENCLYNAADDILTLFASGSRLGLFNVLMLENPSDEFQIKGSTKRWDVEQFKHKIGFCMPRANANSWNITEASMLEENLTALYSDGINKTVFKPYFTVNKEE